MARVVLFEDSLTSATLTKARLTHGGHEIVGIGDTLAASLELIGRVAAGELAPPHAWIVDANLGGGPSDGVTIVRQLDELGLPGQRIGFSADPWPAESCINTDTGKNLGVLMAALGKLAV